MASLKEKIGYGFGDMSSSMFWKIFSCYLPFFYSNIFGLSLVDAGVLMLVCRIWDAVSDPMMGIIADRTKTRWGKYRPYLLWVAAPFSICGILLFTTPDLAYAGKLTWAYVTYILMMTVYTGINVPYGAMLGVMCDNPEEKTVFSAFRMTFAYAGSFVALFAWEPLCNLFKETLGCSPATSWQMAMIVIAAGCLVLFILCFAMTREHLKTVSTTSIGNDFKDLLRNGPWWLLVGAALCFNLANTFRYAGIPYFFSDIIGDNAFLNFGSFGNILFYSGLFLGVGEIANMLGVVLAVPITKKIGKKTSFIMVAIAFAALNVLFWLVPINGTGFWLMMLLQVVISIFTGIMSPLVWSMYADVSDYAELKYKTASTGLVFSSASMAQKFGGALGGAAVMWLLDAAGYIAPAAGETVAAQPDSAINCIWMMMSIIPAGVAVVTAIFVWLYPLTTKRVNEIVAQLNEQRAAKGQL
jgi:GPH family glycoside/pentoside/hexuronide:cation symporter